MEEVVRMLKKIYKLKQYRQPEIKRETILSKLRYFKIDIIFIMIENQVIFQNEYNICYYEENSNNKWEIVRPMAPKEHISLSDLFTS